MRKNRVSDDTLAPTSGGGGVEAAGGGPDHRHHRVLCVGGGAGGINVAAGLSPSVNTAIIEPASTHWYQPGWTLVGGGVRSVRETGKAMKEVIPKDATWYQQSAQEFDPESNTVYLSDGSKVTYDYLVMATGLGIKWDDIEGLRDTLNENGVASNYSSESAPVVWKNIQQTKEGRAIFTFPTPPIKCAGAPQKIMYLADWFWRQQGVRNNINVDFFSPLGKMFAVDKYSQVLDGICQERNLKQNFGWNLVAVRGSSREAVFQAMKDDKPTDETRVEKFDMMHVTPRMGALEVVKQSPLANEAGWVEVDQFSCQHKKYNNVFALGDCSSIPTPKTAAAAGAQAGVVKENLRAAMRGEEPKHVYNGYTSCPLILGRDNLLLAEFCGFNGQPLETFPVDQGTPRKVFYHLKRDVMPMLYWDGMLQGRWHGPDPVRRVLHPSAEKALQGTVPGK